MPDPDVDEDSLPLPIEINRDIACELYAVRYGRLAGSPSPRCYVTVTMDAVLYARLTGLLGANLKGTAVVHFVNIQPPLPDEEPEEPAPSNQGSLPLNPRGLEGIVVDGAAFLAHGFIAGVDDENICDICHTHRITPIHLDQAIEQQPAEERNEAFSQAPYLHAYFANDDDSTCSICGALGGDDRNHLSAEQI